MSTARIAAWLLLVALAVSTAAAAPPGVRLQDPRDGREVLVEPGARVLHLVFFATWCPDCVKELVELAELRARWGDRDYRQVVVAVGTRQTAGRLEEFFAGRELAAELVFDEKGKAEALWSATHVPTHLLLDPAGKELARGGALGKAIEAALAEALGRRRATERRP